MDEPDLERSRIIHQRKIAAAILEQEYRALRLNAKDLAYWTAAISTSASKVTPPDRPCGYDNWIAALNDYARNPPFIGEPPKYPANLPMRLMAFVEDVARPKWPTPRPELIEFALTFLEADVMLYRSGYAKKYLIKRLQQAPLTESHLLRIETLLRRAVTKGTGREEFRAYKKLAAHLFAKVDQSGLVDWLEKTADGAILTLDRADVWTRELMIGALEDDFEFAPYKLDPRFWSVTALSSRSPWGLPFPEMWPPVHAGRRVNEKPQKIKYNAYLLLSSIRRRQLSNL